MSVNKSILALSITFAISSSVMSEEFTETVENVLDNNVISESVDLTDVSDSTSIDSFADIEVSPTNMLVETLMSDDVGSTDIINEDLLSAQQALEELQNNPDALAEDIQEAQLAVDTAQSFIDEIQAEYDAELLATEEVISQLSEKQVEYLNQKLQNVSDGKLLVDIDADDLQKVVDGDYNFQQISAFTQAYEQEARFDLKVDRFISKAEETGNDKFLEHASRMELQGQIQKNKFVAKIDSFAPSKVQVNAKKFSKHAAKEVAKNTAKETAKGVAKQAAKTAAKLAAKSAAKKAAKDAAKKSAKIAAKKAAKDSAKNAAKKAAKRI